MLPDRAFGRGFDSRRLHHFLVRLSLNEAGKQIR